MAKTKKEVQKQGLRPSQKAKAEKLRKKQEAKKLAQISTPSQAENEVMAVSVAIETPKTSTNKRTIKKATTETKEKKTTRRTTTKKSSAKEAIISEQIVDSDIPNTESVATINVKNAEGDPDTVAEILIQNKIDYTPKVSVIMPVYNVEPYLRQCLDSVTSQTLREIEIICVDDGSTDDSLDILKEYAAKDNRITVITQKNAGSGKARNNAINNSNGEFIAFMDSDDLYPSEKTLEHMYKAAIENNVLVCGGSLNQLREGGEIVTDPNEFESEFTFTQEGIVKYSDYQFDYGYWRFIYNRKFLKENQIYFPDYLRQQDPPFCVKAMAKAGEFYAITEPTYVYRISYKQISWNERKAVDLFKGIGDCLEYSKQYNLSRLHVRIAERLNTWTFRTAASAMMKFKSVRMQVLKVLHSIDYKVLEEQNIQLELDDIYKALLKSEENDVLVSVILPVYNVEPYLARCLDSILGQTLPCFEVICVDDGGSTDRSIEILNEYTQKDARIRIVKKKPGNLSAARNFGLKYVKCDFVMFVDSDDWIDETTLEKAVAKMSGQVDLVCWGAKLVNETSDEYNQNIIIGNQYHKIKITGEKEASNSNILQSTYTVWNKLWKKYFFDKYDITFAEGRLYEDNDFSIMYMVHCRHIFYLDEYLYYYVQRPNSLMDKIRARECRKTVDNLYCFDNLYRHLEKYNLSDARKEIIAARYSLHLSAAYKYAPDDLRKYICETAKEIASTYRKELFWNNTIEKLENEQYNKIRECSDIIISLTSYPGRIKTISQVIETLLKQSMKADKVILWLAPEQFPNKEADLPQELLDLREKGLTVDWYHDIRSYKKLIPTLKKYPEAFIATADDDILYPTDWLQKLWISYSKNTEFINCHRAHYINFSRGKIRPYSSWKFCVSNEYPSFFNFCTTGGGVLYPPHTFSDEAFNENLFRKLCPTGDDIWFWAMCVLNGKKIRTVENNIKYIKVIEEAQGESLWNENVIRNDEQIINLTSHYPEILKILSKEKRHSILYKYLLFPYYLYRIRQLKKRYKEISFNNILKKLRGFRVDIRNTGSANNAVEIIGKDISVKNITWNIQNGQGKLVQGNALSNKITVKAIKSGVLKLDFRGQEYKYNGKRFPVWIDYKSIKIDGKDILTEPISVWHDQIYSYEIKVKDKQEIILEIEQQYHEYTEDELRDIVLKLDASDNFISDSEEKIMAKLKKQLPIITSEELNQRKYKNRLSDIISSLTTYRLDIKNFGSENNTMEAFSTDDTIETPQWFSDKQGIGKVIQGSSMKNFIKLRIIKDGKLQIKFRGQDRKYQNEEIPVWIDYKSIKIDGKEILSDTVYTQYYKPYNYEMPVKDNQEVTIEFGQLHHEYTKDELRDILSKLDSQFDFTDDFIEYYENNIGFKEIKYTWEYIKNNILPEEPVSIRIDDINEKIFGRMQISVGTTKFESVLIPSKTKKLYVLLGGYNDKGTGKYPLFARISWCDKLDGISLYFDDPTRIEHNYSPSYYFGNRQENYLQYVREIVKKIAEVHKIDNENIVFIGSSHTGFCALYLANEMLASKGIALCPQIDVKTLCGAEFEKAMGVSCDDPSLFDRLNVLRILKNEKSKFFIFSNMLCNHDKKQMELLYNEAHKKLSLGLVELSKTTKCLLAEISAKSPHHAQPDEYFCRIIEKIMDEEVSEQTSELCEAFIGEMQRFYNQHKEFELLKDEKQKDNDIVKLYKKIFSATDVNSDINISVKKNIKIDVVDTYKGFKKEDWWVAKALEKFYTVEFSDQPDFLFCSCFGTEHLKYSNCVKIFFSGENILPDFNVYDYGSGPDFMEFGDRYFHLHVPVFSRDICSRDTVTDDYFNRKFCNFIYSNGTVGKGAVLRQEFCKKLMEYKHVDCPGRVLNNMSAEDLEPRNGDWGRSKLEFIKKYKFTIAFENSYSNGYTTEKLVQPLQSFSIPIYWGNPLVTKDFNSKAFINCYDYDNDFDAIIERIKELDNNPDKYLAMLRENPMQPDFDFNQNERYIKWLVGIIEKGNKPFDKYPGK